MPTIKERLVVSEFRSPIHEAVLGLLVASSHIRSTLGELMEQEGLTLEQYNILRILRGIHPKGHTCGEISKRMIDRKPDITRRIATLEAAGLVKREKDTEDKRVVFVTITDKGLRILHKLDPAIVAFESEVGSNFTAEECERFSELCSRFLGE